MMDNSCGKDRESNNLAGLLLITGLFFWFLSFPSAYLCLDTVYVGCEGEVLFLKPKNIGTFAAVLVFVKLLF